MSYDASTMRLMGGVPGQQLFLYRTPDAIGTVDDAGYFDAAVDEYNLSTGDMVLAVTSFGGVQALSALVVGVAAGQASVTPLA
ncbi:MAG: hypothetical protein RDU24_15505 [Humidesulfovibrio sp.]|uniref:hypothetical protein n=1 Tax=Humidesulfovibrio sp. TaxID=2910988 RepID=UPI0027F543A6|nr:hypothetical protein [Humidesulfovibrio sp.]MDQ7836785.1 hypothetical protein [Humidesulfovibrio sp.]